MKLKEKLIDQQKSNTHSSFIVVFPTSFPKQLHLRSQLYLEREQPCSGPPLPPPPRKILKNYIEGNQKEDFILPFVVFFFFHLMHLLLIRTKLCMGAFLRPKESANYFTKTKMVPLL